jgi:hypothetical protein
LILVVETNLADQSPDRRIAPLQRKLGEQPAGSLQRIIVAAQLAALAGEMEAARSALSRIMKEHAAALLANEGLFDEALHLATIALDAHTASHLVGRRWGPFSLEFEDRRRSPEAVRWQIGNNRHSKLWVDLTILKFRNSDSAIRRLSAMMQLLTAYCLSHAPAPSELYLNLGDGGHVPGLAFCENRPEFFLVPDELFLSRKGYEGMRQVVLRHSVAWDQRIPIAFWRGSAGGRLPNRALGWRSLPRIQLCMLGREHPDLIDAGLSGVSQWIDSEEDVRATGLMRPYVPDPEAVKYKYQIDIDGNVNSWPGTFQKLLTGNPVVKVASPDGYRQWYYDRLEPWRNFVPVASDMSDLAEKILWLRSHDDDARRIGEAGKQLADALDYRGEILRAGRTIEDALRHFRRDSTAGRDRSDGGGAAAESAVKRAPSIGPSGLTPGADAEPAGEKASLQSAPDALVQ